MKSVKFIKDAWVDRKLVFKVGEVQELSEASAHRWVKRGIATYFEAVKEEEKVEAPVKKKVTRKKKKTAKKVIAEAKESEVNLESEEIL